MSVEGQREVQTRRPRPQVGHGALQPAREVPLADPAPVADQSRTSVELLNIGNIWACKLAQQH